MGDRILICELNWSPLEYGKVQVECPSCKSIMLLDGSQILPDGIVKCTVVCPNRTSCKFNAFIKLEKWDELEEEDE